MKWILWWISVKSIKQRRMECVANVGRCCYVVQVTYIPALGDKGSHETLAMLIERRRLECLKHVSDHTVATLT